MDGILLSLSSKSEIRIDMAGRIRCPETYTVEIWIDEDATLLLENIKPDDIVIYYEEYDPMPAIAKQWRREHNEKQAD